MDKYSTEIFGEFTYAESVTYEDLLAYEKTLQENVELIYLDGGAEHLDFTPLGDMLMFQCAFETKNLEILRDIAEELAQILPEGVKGRVLCLEKDLTMYHLFWLRPGIWQEKKYKLPDTGPEDAITREVERHREPANEE